jgi:hypothetical protein
VRSSEQCQGSSNDSAICLCTASQESCGQRCMHCTTKLMYVAQHNHQSDVQGLLAGDMNTLYFE